MHSLANIKKCQMNNSVGLNSKQSTYFVNKLFSQQRSFYLSFLGFLQWKSIAENSLTFQKSRSDNGLENILKRMASRLGFLFL